MTGLQTSWYVVQALSSGEDKVRKQILESRANVSGMMELIEEVLVPTEKVSEVKAGQQKITQKRIWPGYILIRMKMTDESWHFIKNTNGVISFLGGQKPSPLTQIEVDELLNDLAQKKEEIKHKNKLTPGDKVKITEGVFVNFIGTVLEVNHDKGRVAVIVSIFGRDTRVDDLEFAQVEELIGE